MTSEGCRVHKSLPPGGNAECHFLIYNPYTLHPHSPTVKISAAPVVGPKLVFFPPSFLFHFPCFPEADSTACSNNINTASWFHCSALSAVFCLHSLIKSPYTALFPPRKNRDKDPSQPR